MGVSLVRSVVFMSVGLCAFAATAAAQTQQAPADAAHDAHQHEVQAPEHDHSQHMAMETFPAREGSGTSWLPDNTPMYGVHRSMGSWQLMAHGNAFAQYLYESGDRGSDQFGSINWVMGMARRQLGGGRVGVRGMFSLEPWTIPGCGYPDLLATGEVCDSQAIHDRQHPHDLFMELALEYEHPLGRGLTWQVYGGPAGEPALGPVAFPHRSSAQSNPLAPITHHWLDATHITFGVVTGGVMGARWKAEASAFNGREPDEHRTDLDLDTLDSYSGRFSWMPSPRVAIQLSSGRLNDAEGPGENVTRTTASLTYHTATANGRGLWASTIAWGRNGEAGEGTQAFLVETGLSLNDRDAWFGRFEVADKSAHDLAIEDADQESFVVAKLQGGYTRYFRARAGLQAGVGGGLSASFIPGPIGTLYGGGLKPGVAVFFTVRPASHRM